ncbi:MAG: permease [Hyphomicrobiales bacterium]|nr:permease [Hyphomicrobiales bacterium]MCP4999731.1 permease [Hyphomicrobiales bacterium]
MTDISQTGTGHQARFRQWLTTPWSVVVTAPLLVLIFDRANALPVTQFAANAFIGTLPYIVIAVIMIAWLKAAGAEAYVARAFEGRETRMIVFAALLGGLAPFCSCEVIPFIAGLLTLGAPLSAVMAFWLSSPLVDPPTLIITASALGWPFAVGKALAAVAMGLFGGFAIKAMMAGGLFANPLRVRGNSGCGCGPSPFDGKPEWAFWQQEDRRVVFREQFVENALFLVKWLAMAYVLEALLVTYVPASLIVAAVGGNGIGSIATAAIVGMPAYLNGYVAPPLLAGLMEQGMSAGAAMAFMVAGAVSSIPAMAAVWSLVRRDVFASYLGLGLVGAIVSGIVFQLIG